MSNTKRVYLYLVYFITLGMFSSGVVLLLRICFDVIIKHPASVQIGAQGFSREALSLGLAMIVIGGLLWFLFSRAIQRNVTDSPAEVGSVIRKFFMNIIIVVSMLLGLFAAGDFLKWLMAGVVRNQFPSGGLSMLIVTGVIWYYHWHREETEGQPSPASKTLRRWYIYLLSGWGLVSLSMGIVGLVNAATLNLSVWGTAIVSSKFWNTGTHSSIGWILVGGSAWFFHWFRMVKGDYQSTLRQVYLYLLAILGGSIAGLVALTMILFKVIRFAFGDLSVPATMHYQFSGWAVPTILVTAAIWSYHQSLAQEEASQVQEQQLSARRIHSYIMSFLGLGTLISGLITLIGILLDLIINASTSKTIVITPGWWRDQLSICIALLLVATPLWLYYWNRVLQTVASGGVAERRAQSRRIFLYIVLGASVITLAADLVNIVYQLLNSVLQGTFGVDVLRHIRWSLQTLIVAVPLLMYFWRIMRQDQRLGAEITTIRKTVTVLVSDRATGIVSRIEQRLGYRVHTLHHLEQTPGDFPVLSDEELNRIAGDIEASPVTTVMLIAAGGRIIVLPYREK